MKATLGSMLALSLVTTGLLLAQQPSPSHGISPKATVAAAASSQGQGDVQPAPSSRSGTHARSHSYRREVSTRRRHSSISKEEKIFLVAIAGTSMGIGALAGGPKGLAIGAIVGGWGAYAGHRLWHWIR
jgi:hypothetical protein